MRQQNRDANRLLVLFRQDTQDQEERCANDTHTKPVAALDSHEFVDTDQGGLVPDRKVLRGLRLGGVEESFLNFGTNDSRSPL